MPSGRIHDRITLWTLPLVLLAAFYVTLDLRLTLVVCASFLFGGFMFGPDLDIHSVQYKRWGWFRWIWLPYRKSLKHRSRWSHGPIIGTVLRVLYFFAWVALLGVLVLDVLNSVGQVSITWGDLIQGMGQYFRQYWRLWLSLLVGLETGALSHYAADWLISAAKKSKGHKRRKSSKAKSSYRRQPPKKRRS